MATEDIVPRSAVLREARRSGKKIRQSPIATVSVKEACAQLNICRSTLYKLIRKKEIKSLKIEGRRLFRQSAVRRYIEQREKEEEKA